MSDASCDFGLRRFWEMLAAGYCAGEPLLSTLSSIEEACRESPVGEAAGRLADDIGEGLILSAAMRNQPETFTKAHVALIEGGELLGIVDRVLLLLMEATWRCPTCGNLQQVAERD